MENSDEKRNHSMADATLIEQLIKEGKLEGPQDKSILRFYQNIIIVADSQTINDYEFFCEIWEDYIRENKFKLKDAIVLTGMARHGPDNMIIQWCQEHKRPYVGFPADWNNPKLGKRAGYVRNEQMGEFATHLFMIWDGHSNDSRHMLEVAKTKELIYRLIRFWPDNENPKLLVLGSKQNDTKTQ